VRVKVSILLFFFVLMGCATPTEWTKGDKIAAGYFLLGHTADFLTTERNLDGTDTFSFYEMNPILGKHPSDTELMFYVSLSAIGGLMIAHFCPKYRKLMLGAYGTANWGCAIHNQELWNKYK